MSDYVRGLTRMKRSTEPRGALRHGKRRIQSSFTQEMFDEIAAEARAQDWTLSYTVVHLAAAGLAISKGDDDGSDDRALKT